MAATRHLSKLISALGAALFFITASCPAASAEDYTSVQTYIHAFDNGVTVYTGVFALNRDLDLDTSVYAKYNIDLINPRLFLEGHDGGDGGDDDDSLTGSSKNVAAVSGASSAVAAGGVSDTRHEFTGGITRNFSNIFGVEAYLDYSWEKDYASLTPSITLKKDLFGKNTTLSLGYSRNMDDISGQFLGGTFSRTTDNYYIGLTQVLSPVALAQAGYARIYSRGQESEGIRLVPVAGATLASCTAVSATCLNEVFPDKRTRNAYMAGFSYYFTEGTGAGLDRSAMKFFVRYYKDDWEIRSWTGEAEWDKYLDKDLILGLSYRYYTQTRAFFDKETYTTLDQYLTVSPQLTAFDSHLAGVKVTYKLDVSPDLDGIGLGSVEGKYQFYNQSTGVSAHVVMLGLNLAF